MCVGFLDTLCPNDLSFWITNSTFKKGIVLSSFVIAIFFLNGYPKKFTENAMKTQQYIREKTEYRSSVSLPYIGSASHKAERILKEAGIQVYHSSEDKLF